MSNHLGCLRENEDVPEVPYGEGMRAWFDLCRDHPYLAFICNFPMTEPIPPRPMQSEAFKALVGTLREETQRRILLELLIDLLAPSLIELIHALKTRGEI